MMNLVSWKPWKPFGDLFSRNRQISRLFDEAFGDIDNETLPTWYPAADIYETKDDYVFKLEVPGLKKDDINIQLKDHTLSIKGEKKEEKEVKKDDYHRIESYSGTFSRSFVLPKDIDAGKVNASMKDGVLVLRVAKAEEQKPKAIP
ncbi:MAG: Hsp20/alpha crystallin family protein, partial [Candidatus Aminicenantes bacterium]